MHPADMHALGVIENIRTRFDLAQSSLELPDSCAAEGVLIGFEVEVPWRLYFPNLWDTYFLGGRRKFEEIPNSEQDALIAECWEPEARLRPRLYATEECGVGRGKDAYWEFVFPPTNNLALASEMFRLLADAGVLPAGFCSLHATISGITSPKLLYATLFLLELGFVRKERIAQCVGGNRGWAGRGEAGIRVKGPHDLLYGAQKAYELRTLELPVLPSARAELFTAIALLTHYLVGEAGKQGRTRLIVQKIEALLGRHGLPFKVWGHPADSPKVWQRYVERFDELSASSMEILQNDLGVTITP